MASAPVAPPAQPAFQPQAQPQPAQPRPQLQSFASAQQPGTTSEPSASGNLPNGSGPRATVTVPAPVGRLLELLRDRRLVWGVVALLCLAGGTIGSVLGGEQVARNDTTDAKRASTQSAAAVATAAKLALQREQQLSVAGATFFAGNSKATRAEFARWAKWAQTLRRNPELEQLGLVALVHADELATFGKPKAKPPTTGTVASGSTASSAPSSSTTPSATTGASSTSGTSTVAGIASTTAPALPTIKVKPAGERPFYCLALANLARNRGEKPAAGEDYCAMRGGMLRSRDTGFSHYKSVTASGAPALEVLMPVYKGNQPPATLGARMGAFAGWLREVFAPGVIVNEALQARPGDAVSIAFHSSTANVAFTGGSVERTTPHTTIDLHNGWVVQGFGAPFTTGLGSDGDALALLIAGCALSALLAMVVFVLGGGATPPPATTTTQSRETPPGEDLHDALTGLPNRALMIDRAECMLGRAGRQQGLLVGALFIDIDWFEDVNERLGRKAGDQILKIVAQRLEAVVRAGDTVGRLGGDEFVLLVETAARGARLDSLARRVVEALHKPFDLDDFGPNFFLTASIGVAFGRYANADDLLRDAQLALHAAKSAGKDRYTLFNANMRSVIEGRGVLEAELNVALSERQLFALYEPIYDLETGQVAGMEALVRWLHPKQGVLGPAEFMALAEETGLSVPIGRWILEEACTRAAAWNVAGYPIGVSVEVSPNQLNREGFVTDVRRALQQSGIDPSLVTLQIAETTVMRDVNDAVERLREIKQLGVRIAIDDFGGSGYAYHSDLRRLPLDFLKVDRSSLAATEDEDYRTWLLEAIMIVGRDLSLTVIAKGIESLEQMSALQTMGCTMAQGALLGKPVPSENIENVLVSRLPIVRAVDAPSA